MRRRKEIPTDVLFARFKVHSREHLRSIDYAESFLTADATDGGGDR